MSRIMARYGGIIERAIRTSEVSQKAQMSPSRSMCSSFQVGTSTTPTWMIRGAVL